MAKFTQSQHTRFTEKTLSLFVKFIIVCEDNYNRLKWELDNEDCGEDWKQEVKEKLNHYLLLYKDIKEHTGLTSEVLDKRSIHTY